MSYVMHTLWNYTIVLDDFIQGKWDTRHYIGTTCLKKSNIILLRYFSNYTKESDTDEV